jgi:hypothetical protein
MSGNPAFQGSPQAFQASAFQSGVLVTAANYSVGSPSFLTPALGTKFVFTTPAYSLGSPSFATPTLTSAAGSNRLTANPYSVASPAFATPGMRFYLSLRANPYSLASPSFAMPAQGQKFHFFTNAMVLSALSWMAPLLQRNFKLTTAAYSLASPAFAQDVVAQINHTLTISTDGYSLDHPRFGFPRLTVTVVQPSFPRTYYSQVEEAAGVLDNLLNYILMSLPPGQTPQRDYCRRLATTMRADPAAAIRGDTLGTDLQNIFVAADAAGATYGGIEAARQYLMSEADSTSVWTQTLLDSALVMTLAEECNIITRMSFASQSDVQTMILHVQDMFEQATALGIEELDVTVYRTLTAMGGAIMNYLASTELQLPRYMAYRAAAPFPSLYLAQRIYADPTRADELERENGVVNPCFMPVMLRVLSNPPIGLS